MPAGSRKTLNKTATDRIRYNDKYDRNSAGSLSSLLCAQPSHRDNRVDFFLGKLACKRTKPCRLLGGNSRQELNVLALDIAKLAERFCYNIYLDLPFIHLS